MTETSSETTSLTDAVDELVRCLSVARCAVWRLQRYNLSAQTTHDAIRTNQHPGLDSYGDLRDRCNCHHRRCDSRNDRSETLMPLYEWICIVVSTVLFLGWLLLFIPCIKGPGQSNYGSGWAALIILLGIALAPAGGAALFVHYQDSMMATAAAHSRVQPRPPRAS